MSLIRLESTEPELEALHQVCNRLVGFDPRLSLEWLDGALTAVMAGPSVPESAQALIAPLFGDAWPRTFADPDDEAQALAPLAARWRVLRSQLDPDALYDDFEHLRLAPLLLAAPDEPVEGFAVGREWAWGFQAVVRDPAWGWAAVAADEDFEAMMAVLQSLADEDGDTAEREQRVDAAAFAAQDLRLWWLEHAPRTAPRKAEALPGRNDPCHCGSGKKFKKCHGKG